LVAGVEEQLRVGGLLDERAGGVHVAVTDEERVGLHRVHLYWLHTSVGCFCDPVLLLGSVERAVGL